MKGRSHHLIKEHGNKEDKKEDLGHWVHNCQLQLRVLLKTLFF